MCGSALSVKGGMVSVVKNYLNYKNWGDIKVDYIPTHIEKNKYWLILYFGLKYLYIVFNAMIGKYQIVHLQHIFVLHVLKVLHHILRQYQLLIKS